MNLGGCSTYARDVHRAASGIEQENFHIILLHSDSSCSSEEVANRSG